MINSIEDLYLTYSTVMKDLIDNYEKERMMTQVLDDLQNNEEIIQYVKSSKRKKRIFICDILMDWFIAQGNFTSLTTSYRSRFYRGAERELIKIFDIPFSQDVVNHCYQTLQSKELVFTISSRRDTEFNITMFGNERRPYDEIGKMTLKYNEKNNTLKVCYIHHYNYFNWIIKEYLDHTLNMFSKIEDIVLFIEEKYSKKPVLIHNKKYEKLVNQAYEKKYLENLKKID